MLFDVDCTVVDASAHHLRPGILEMFEILNALGYEIHLWSAASRHHCLDVLKEHESLRPFISNVHDKPDPVSPPPALWGRIILLTIDDSPRERDPYIPFVRVNPYFGPSYLVDGQVPEPKDRWAD